MVVHLVWWHSWNSSNIFHPIHGVLIIRDRDIPASVWMEMVFYFEINIKCNVFANASVLCYPCSSSMIGVTVAERVPYWL